MTLMQIRRLHTKFRCSDCEREIWKYNQFFAMPNKIDIFCMNCGEMTVHDVVKHDVRLSEVN